MFGWHICGKKDFLSALMACPLKNFPISAADFEQYIRSNVIGSPSLQAVVIIPGNNHDVLSLLSTPKKLGAAMRDGREVMINDIYQPIVG